MPSISKPRPSILCTCLYAALSCSPLSCPAHSILPAIVSDSDLNKYNFTVFAGQYFQAPKGCLKSKGYYAF